MTLFDGPSIYLLQPTGKENHSDAKHNTVGYFYPLSVSSISFVKGPWYCAAITAVQSFTQKNLVIYQGKL